MSLDDLEKRLVRIVKTINEYNKKNKLIREIEIDIPISELEQIAPEDDVYDGSELDESQLQKINSYLDNKIEADFEKYSYFLVTSAIYDWG